MVQYMGCLFLELLKMCIMWKNEIISLFVYVQKQKEENSLIVCILNWNLGHQYSVCKKKCLLAFSVNTHGLEKVTKLSRKDIYIDPACSHLFTFWHKS